MREYHKALVIALACAMVLAAGLVRAYLSAPKPLTSAEVLAATRRAVEGAVNTAISLGGLEDAEALVRSAIAANLRAEGFGGVDVRIARPNDLNPLAAFFFLVEVGDLVVRFDVEGTRDPLLAIRLALDVRIRADPFRPYTSHREPGILASCVAGRYYHLAPEGPDLFARLENRTGDPFHFGFEVILQNEERLAVDHALLATGKWELDAVHRARYGL